MIYLITRITRIFDWIRMAFQAVRNARNAWEPELKNLHDNLLKLEDSLAGTDDCVVDIFSLEEKHEDRLNVLEEELPAVKTSLADLENHLNSLIKKMFDAVKVENVEMRNHFNSMTKELNDIKKLLMTENEKTFEIEAPPKGYNLRKGI